MCIALTQHATAKTIALAPDVPPNWRLTEFPPALNVRTLVREKL